MSEAVSTAEAAGTVVNEQAWRPPVAALRGFVDSYVGFRQAGVEAILQVYEGQSHAHYLRDDSAPETKEVFAEISGFFDKHLGK